MSRTVRCQPAPNPLPQSAPHPIPAKIMNGWKKFFQKTAQKFLNSPKRSLRFETFYLDKYLLWHALNADDRDDDDDDDDQCDQICAKYCHFGNNLKVFGHLK